MTNKEAQYISSDQLKITPYGHEITISKAVDRCIQYRSYIYYPRGIMMYINSVEALYLSLVNIKNKRLKEYADNLKKQIFEKTIKKDIIERYDEFLNGMLHILGDNDLLFKTRFLEIGIEKIK